MRGAVLLLLAGCFHPDPATGAPCASTGACPTPLVCLADVCTTAGPTDAGPGADGPADASTDALQSGPRLLLHMDDDPSDGALDSAANHAAVCDPECPRQTGNAHAGEAYRFRGKESLAVTPAIDFHPGPAGFTLATWVNVSTPPTAPQTFYALVAKGLPPDDASFGLSVTGSPLHASYYTSQHQSNGTAPLAVGTWHHVAMTWTPTAVTGYLDGVQDAQQASLPLVFDDAAPLTIGVDNDANGLVGLLDELAYYDRPLSATEIAALAAP